MKLTMLLADSAQAIEGKLYILGGGWSITGPDPSPMALALKLEVPWDQANIKHELKLVLLDADGQGVQVPTPMGDQPFEIRGELEVGRPPGLKAGTPLDAAMAVNLGPIALPPDSRFVWRCYINDQTREDWQVTFSTRPVRQ